MSQQRTRRLEVFKRELRALERIKHRNVVKLWGLGVDPCDEYVYIVLEMGGVSGWEWVEEVYKKKAGFDRGVVKAWAELAEGCAEMAKQGILHRDLTLDNILVSTDEEGKVTFKVCDFGVSGTAADFKDIPRGKMRNYPPEAMVNDRPYEYTS